MLTLTAMAAYSLSTMTTFGRWSRSAAVRSCLTSNVRDSDSPASAETRGTVEDLTEAIGGYHNDDRTRSIPPGVARSECLLVDLDESKRQLEFVIICCDPVLLVETQAIA